MAPKALRISLFSLILSSSCSAKAFGIDQIDHAQAGARGFVAVGRADAALGGADFVFALENFALLIEFAVIRETRDGAVSLMNRLPFDLDAELAQALDFLDQADRVDDDAIADDAHFLRAQDAGGDQMQDIFLVRR